MGIRIVEVACKNCGAEFCVKVEGRGSAPGYCSLECRYRRLTDEANRRAREAKGTPTHVLDRVCEFCEEPFMATILGRSSPPKYCSVQCRADGAARKQRVRRRSAEPCTIPGCELPRRSLKSEWCEMHYGRNRRNGDPVLLHVRLPNGLCHHCGAEAAAKNLFCSALCRRRDRLKLPGTVLTCIVCQGEIPEDRRSHSLYCGIECQYVANKAKMYKVSLEEMYLLIRKAEGLCTICKAKEPSHIDHCHDTGLIRGFICGQCNVGIGMFQNSPAALRAAADYLEQNAAVIDEMETDRKLLHTPV